MLNAKSTALLAVISAAMQTTLGYAMCSAKETAELVSNGFAEQNETITEGNGFGKKFATRLTPAGLAHMTQPVAGTPATNTTGFEIEDGIALPSARGGKNQSVYPFDQLGVNQSFHVPASTDKPNPAKSLASTVSSATKRYAEGDDKRVFTVRSVGDNDPKGKGARVFRLS